MRLQDLLAAGMPGVLAPADANPEISAVVYDSRRVGPGALFFCVPGERTDGHRFAQQAVDAGAAALVVEHSLGLGVPEVQVQSARSAMAAVAARFYGEPTQRLAVVGITGTNGKTTTAFMVRALMQAGGRRCGLLGTVKSVVGGVERPAERTTPEALDLQADFRAMLEAGELSCAMEVSSHALQLERTEGVRFAAAIFTNLTQDHLDFHHSMERYFQAKRMLFVGRDAPPLKVLNVGDPYGRRLALELGDAVTFGVECEADYVARDVRIDSRGASARVLTPDRELELGLPLPGRFNVENALGALACVHQLGGDLESLLDALRQGVRVPGRFEPVEEGQGFAVLVDYAHTPDSLSNVLSAAREITQGRVLCVFGAGGDRDRGKRPLMGEIGARLADVAVITSDNPRSEDPQQIVEQVLAGARRVARGTGAHPPHPPAAVEVEVDRRAAIAHALELALPGDVVVIAGKGHEQGQELAGGVKIPFDDVTVAREQLRAEVLMGRILIGGTAALLICIFLSPKFIAFLRKREFGQQIREEGPEGHHHKAGTPTMGGVIVMAAMAIPFLILTGFDEWRALGIFGVAIACALLGFADDYTKLARRRSLGLRGRTKLIVTVVISVGLWLIAVHGAHLPSTLRLRVVDYQIELGPFYPLLIYLVVAGTTSAVNLTDGLDGLAAGCTAIVALTYIAIAIIAGEPEVALIAGCIVGAAVGFLWFNAFPATVFMGDTGSLGLGGAIAGLAVMTKTEILLIIIGGIFVIEALSVLIQVAYFQWRRKRVFLMAPIHHHFELQGWSETKIILRFWIVAAVCAAIGFTLYKQSVG